jgi:predicted RecB family endonuclease
MVASPANARRMRTVASVDRVARGKGSAYGVGVVAGSLDVLLARYVKARLPQAKGVEVDGLCAANDELRAALIELHVEVERRSDEAARRIEASIWRELVTSTERRKMSVAPF